MGFFSLAARFVAKLSYMSMIKKKSLCPLYLTFFSGNIRSQIILNEEKVLFQFVLVLSCLQLLIGGCSFDSIYHQLFTQIFPSQIFDWILNMLLLNIPNLIFLETLQTESRLYLTTLGKCINFLQPQKFQICFR